MTTLRVLYSFPHVMGRPGIATTARHHVEALAALGHEVTLWCTAAEADVSGVSVVETLRFAGQRVPQRAIGVSRSYRYHDRRVARHLARNLGRYDAVHTWPLGALATLEVARKWGVAAVREVPNTHTANAFEASAAEWRAIGLQPPRGHSHTPNPAKLAREEAEYAAASLLLTPSPFVAQTFVERGVPAARLFHHGYGYDPATFRPHPGSRPPGRPFTAVFAGAGEPRKGLHYALEAWHASGAAENGLLRICGRIEAAYGGALRSALDHPSIQVKDFCSNLASVLATADVLVLPSVEEGSALVSYEAMACGAVPLVSEAVGAPCRDGVDALVHRCRDVQALTRHLALLSTDAAELARLRQGAIESSASLTWLDSGRRLLAGYRTASASCRPPEVTAAVSTIDREGV